MKTKWYAAMPNNSRQDRMRFRLRKLLLRRLRSRYSGLWMHKSRQEELRKSSKRDFVTNFMTKRLRRLLKLRSVPKPRRELE